MPVLAALAHWQCRRAALHYLTHYVRWLLSEGSCSGAVGRAVAALSSGWCARRAITLAASMIAAGAWRQRNARS